MKEVSPEIRSYLAALGSKGGKTRWSRMTQEQKKAHMEMMRSAKKAKKG